MDGQSSGGGQLAHLLGRQGPTGNVVSGLVMVHERADRGMGVHTASSSPPKAAGLSTVNIVRLLHWRECGIRELKPFGVYGDRKLEDSLETESVDSQPPVPPISTAARLPATLSIPRVNSMEGSFVPSAGSGAGGLSKGHERPIWTTVHLQKWAELHSLYHLKQCHIALQSSARTTISVAFSPDGSYLASSHGGDHSVRITRTTTLQAVQAFRGHPRTPWSVRFHPFDSNIVASGCLGQQVRLWNITEGRCMAVHHVDAAVLSVFFHPSGDVVGIAAGRCIYCWHWRSGECRVVRTHASPRAFRAGLFPMAPCLAGRVLLTCETNMYPAGFGLGRTVGPRRRHTRGSSTDSAHSLSSDVEEGTVRRDRSDGRDTVDTSLLGLARPRPGSPDPKRRRIASEAGSSPWTSSMGRPEMTPPSHPSPASGHTRSPAPGLSSPARSRVGGLQSPSRLGVGGRTPPVIRPLPLAVSVSDRGSVSEAPRSASSGIAARSTGPGPTTPTYPSTPSGGVLATMTPPLSSQIPPLLSSLPPPQSLPSGTPPSPWQMLATPSPILSATTPSMPPPPRRNAGRRRWLQDIPPADPVFGLPTTHLGMATNVPLASQFTTKLQLWPFDSGDLKVVSEEPLCSLPNAVVYSDTGCDVSPNGQYLAVCMLEPGDTLSGGTHYLLVVSLRPGEVGRELYRIPLNDKYTVTSVRFSPTSQYIMLGYGGSTRRFLVNLGEEDVLGKEVLRVIAFPTAPPLPSVEGRESGKSEANDASVSLTGFKRTSGEEEGSKGAGETVRSRPEEGIGKGVELDVMSQSSLASAHHGEVEPLTVDPHEILCIYDTNVESNAAQFNPFAGGGLVYGTVGGSLIVAQPP